MAKWTGWWEQRGLGRRTMHNLVLDIAASGAVAGGGEDCVGRFSFEGRFLPDGTVSLIKQYLGRHCVSYEGQNSGEGIFGTWTIWDFWTGKFALRPLADHEVAYDAIQELVPVRSAIPQGHEGATTVTLLGYRGNAECSLPIPLALRTMDR